MESKKIISWMYMFGLGLMIASLPLSKFMMSVSQFFLSGTLIIDFINREKILSLFRRESWKTDLMLIPTGIYFILESVVRIFARFYRRDNMPAIIFSSLFLLHILGLVFTTDFTYAFKDIRIKLPLFILPIIISISPSLDYKKFRFLMLLFSLAVVAGTLISTQIMLTENLTDPRHLSIFISHIRFSLLIAFAVYILIYFAAREKEFKKSLRIVLALLAIWLAYYLFLSAFMTGLVILSATLVIYAIIKLFISGSLTFRILVPAGILTALIVLGLILAGIVRDVYRTEPIDFSQLEEKTAQGNLYWHDTTLREVENGHYVWIYIASGELKEAWNKRSKLNFNGKDEQGQDLKFTLLRFLTSKGYRKDAEGVKKLSDEEVRLVEQGVASIVYHERSNFYVRVYKMIWGFKQYMVTSNPSGKSVLQRVEYWRVSLGILDKYWVTGVGTGDLKVAFEKQYKEMKSPLPKALQWRSHNQYLAIFIAFGIFGLAWFMVTLIYPPLKLKMFNDYFYLIFFIIITLSMLTEDTLETQAGATIFAFFSSLLLFGRKWKLKA
jgi:hypothetical protein